MVSQHNMDDYDINDMEKSCTIGQSFTAFRCWKYGFLSYFTAIETEISDLKAIECKHGVYILNSGYYTITSSPPYHIYNTHYLTIIDSEFIGELYPSDECEDDYLYIYDQSDMSRALHLKSGLLMGTVTTHSKNFPPFR